ncbi:MAG: hypothetical protein D6776_04820, partial [Planctomycetota bacterium]
MGRRGTDPGRGEAVMGSASPLGVVSWVNELLQRHQELFFLYSDNPVWHLLLVVAALGLLFLLRLRRWTRRIERARARIPLSIGGWGTRGKSGTARKKSALLHALGLEVFTKTTGCEAMVIHALPDRPALELFLYRPYDKATIWEQKDVLGIAADTEPHVFLYECMALNPRYVEIIAQQWMRDDVATITNTYPDHEDIQGPRGIDLPQVMARFLPRNAPCFTAEHTMRPILEDAARRRGCRLEGVGWREAAMIPDDVLARYPYRVHPMNLALVTRLGESLGIEREFAWKEIADWIVPDLGVLKVFPEARHRGRRLTFSNGHSANERHGFNANWKRLGLDRFDARAEPGRWLVTVVNNRGDRIARSKVFADCMVHDVRVHRHLLIGTNLTGLRGYVEASLERRLAGLRLLPDGPIEDGAAARREAHERLEQQLAYLCWEVREPADVVEKLRCMLQGLEIEPAVIERWCGDRSLCEAIEGSRLRCVEIDPLCSGAAAGRDLALDEALASLETSLVRDEGLDPDVARAVTSWLERWTRELGTLRALRRVIDDLLSAPPTASSRAQLDELLRSFVRRAFLDKLHALEDPTASGDRVVDFVARACPPGLAVHVHGAQNIKGPGLDWCYRWIGLERVREQVAALRDRSAERRRQALAWLGSHTDYGLLDAPVAIEAIEAAR